MKKNSFVLLMIISLSAFRLLGQSYIQPSSSNPGNVTLNHEGNIIAPNLIINRGTINSSVIDQTRTMGLYRVSYAGHSQALVDFTGFTGSTPRFQLKAHYGDKLYFRAARDSETNWDSKGFKEVVLYDYDGKIDAPNILINRGTINSSVIDQTRTMGLYRVSYAGHSQALADFTGFTGSTPRFQLKAHYGDKLYFRAARDSETNWDSKGFKEVVLYDYDGKIDAPNILINRGTINSSVIDQTRTMGLYRVSYAGHSQALVDFTGFTGSTPRFQLKAHYGDKLYFRAARDNEDNWDSKGFREIIMANESGKVGIGTTDPQTKLHVNGDLRVDGDFYHRGTLKSKEIKVELSETGWKDYVFDKSYNLRTLEKVETFIKENKHLPDIPSENEVKENGINLGEMNAKLLQKIEELTLYTIAQQKEIEELKAEMVKLKQKD
jgi:N-formylglutamate amidohydrolase